MEFIKWFKDINKDSIPVAGGKGSNLGEMWNVKFPIPNGFVVTAQTYKEFIERTHIKDKILQMLYNLDVEDTAALQKVSGDIQALITSTVMPSDMQESIIESYEILGLEHKVNAQKVMTGNEEFVAVRSSATAEDLPEASFAGQQATFLNVKGKDQLIKAVRDCWASLFTARAIYYRHRNNFPTEKVFIAVVVQRMVNSEKAGVMFTINPATNEENEIVIEGAYGLGEAVVSGQVSPDLYIVDKSNFEIKTIEIKQQKIKIIRDPKTGGNIEKKLTPEEENSQILTDREIQTLARYGKKIEAHYGRSQDIEWAIEGDRVYIVQSRAVTTFKKKEVKAEANGHGNVLLKGEPACSGISSGPVRVVTDMAHLDKVLKGDIMVTVMTNPDMVPAMQKAAGIITDEGGMTSHAAIVSREMGTPCIVGTETATKVLKDGQVVTVDATNGTIYEGATKVEKKEEHIVMQQADDVTGTLVKVILDFPDRALEVAEKTNADGVGLLRLEFIIASGGIHPAQYIRENKDEEYIGLLVNQIGKVAAAFKGKPVWVRCSDLRSDEYRNLIGGDKEPHESDPMIGWHAIRRLLDEPRILKAEYTAIMRLHKQGFKNVGIMLPFVINVSEIRKAKQYLREVGMEPCKDVKFGIMVETPAICWVIEDVCKEGIDFVSFGTNDLTQLTLGIDRNNQRIQNQFDEMHPAVLGELSMVIKACRKHGVETSICGQAASRSEMAEFLVKHGIDSVSPNPDAVHQIRHVIARTERKILLELKKGG